MARNPRKRRIEEDNTDEDSSTEENSSGEGYTESENGTEDNNTGEEYTESENGTEENNTGEEYNSEEEFSEQEGSEGGEEEEGRMVGEEEDGSVVGDPTLAEEDANMEDEHTDNENIVQIARTGEVGGINLSWNLTCVQLIRRNNIWVERGGKLLLPVSILARLNLDNVPDPYTFKIINPSNQLFTHASVFEFTANPDEVNMPTWMMRNLGLQPGEPVSLELVQLPKAEFCRLEPLTRNFAYVSNTKEVLEHQLNYFGCLTEGDTLFIHERDKLQMYKLKVVELRPSPAVRLFELDMELDVQVPKKPEQKAPIKCDTETPTQNFQPFQGTGHSLGTKQDENKKRDREEEEDNSDEPPTKKFCANNEVGRLILIRQKQKEFVKRQESESFIPFSGPGHVLKGEFAENSSDSKMDLGEVAQDKDQVETGGPENVDHDTKNNANPKVENEPVEEVNLTELVFIRTKQHKSTMKQAENKNQVTPFSGQGYSLR